MQPLSSLPLAVTATAGLEQERNRVNNPSYSISFRFSRSCCSAHRWLMAYPHPQPSISLFLLVCTNEAISLETIDGGFKVVDANKQAIAYVYGHADKRDAEIAGSMTLDHARRVAAHIAKLPKLLEAKLAKKDHIATKLLLGPHQRVLDTGCGWGRSSAYAGRARRCE